jgi:hypothetical protein
LPARLTDFVVLVLEAAAALVAPPELLEVVELLDDDPQPAMRTAATSRTNGTTPILTVNRRDEDISSSLSSLTLQLLSAGLSA